MTFSAMFSINTHVGYNGRIITFDASPSTDPDGDMFALQARWDFDADGRWDSDYSLEKRINWAFTGSGYHRVILEVMDQDGLTSQALDSIKSGPLLHPRLLRFGRNIGS
ncbi:MAG: PKD domain-containing protein [Bacteroidia bacterium]|nr:PKD domain-containing protein [Bacteroidia bacterium]